MGAAPLLSVIVPVYNGGETLRIVLTAMRRSTFQDFELIVVDDGSTDGSGEVAAAFTPQVLRTTRPRSGPAAARNIGSHAAAGQYLCFIDADCEPGPDTLAGIVSTFRGAPEVVAVFGSYDDRPAATGFVTTYKNLFHHYTHQRGNGNASTFWAGCGAVRKDVFLRLGGFDSLRYTRPSIEDIELGYRLTSAGSVRLDPSIQVKHHKRWTLRTMLASDIFDRAIPWTRLMVARGKLTNDLNLQVRHRVSALLAGVLVASLFAAAFDWRGLGLVLVLFAAMLLLLLNLDVYRFFVRKRGWLFALRAIFLHWLYYLYSTAAFAAGLVLERGAGPRHRRGVPKTVRASEEASSGDVV